MSEVLFINAKIYSPEYTKVVFGSVAVKDGLIVDIGLNPDMISKYKNYNIIDLQNHILLPGFSDSHIHFTAYALKLNRLNLDNLSLESILNLVKEKTYSLHPGEWILGQGWNKNIWDTNEFPDKTHLDKVAPNHPVCLESRDYHSVWVNSYALNLIPKKETSYPSSLVPIAYDGTPKGLFFEEAVKVVKSIIPEPTDEMKKQAYQNAINRLHAFGVTSIHTFESLTDCILLNKITPFPLRITAFIPHQEIHEFLHNHVNQLFNNDFFRFRGFKFFMDGALGSQTALMFEPYADNPENFGEQCITTEELEEKVRIANQHQIPCAIHAIGDKANQIAIICLQKFRHNRVRNRIEHAQLVRDEDIPIFQGQIVSAQPIHIREDIATAEKYWGKRSENAYPFRKLINSGAILAFGSDAPVETPDVFEGIYTAMTRTPRNSHQRWHPEHSLSLQECLHAYTLGAAYAAGTEDFLGSIKIGKKADFIVLSEDIFEINPEFIPRIKVILTVVNGEIVYKC